MSKFLKVPNGDYKVQVQEGGEIILDTGVEDGRVIVTGDLIVTGNTTTVESEELTVRDNIIEVNADESGAGITLGKAGLRIDRGSLVDGYFVFDESVEWSDPITATLIQGAFRFENAVGGTVGISTNSIHTGGGDLYLINSGNGVISVTGTANYEDNVLDDDHVPNKKYVDDFVVNYFNTVFQSRIGDGEPPSEASYVEVLDDFSTGLPSRVEIGIDGSARVVVFEDRTEFTGDLRIQGTKIETINSNEDFVLSAPGTGKIRIQDTLNITRTPSIDDPDLDPLTQGIQYTPGIPDEGLNLFVSDRNLGGSGLFFVHDDNTTDELISNNRALVYSMLF